MILLNHAITSLRNLFKDFTGLLFTELCNACGKHLYHGEVLICTTCLFDLPYTDHHKYADNKVAKKFWGRLSCQNAMAMLQFRKGNRVQNLLHSLKYKNQQELGIKLGRMLGERLLLSSSWNDIDLIIPVPLHHKRERIRGYNQSKCIADGISQILNIPVNTTSLLRVLTTESQTRKTRYKRFENMSGVFLVKQPQEIKHKHILLVDDVITTGSTLEVCGNELLKCNPEKISIAAIAFAD